MHFKLPQTRRRMRFRVFEDREIMNGGHTDIGEFRNEIIGSMKHMVPVRQRCKGQVQLTQREGPFDAQAGLFFGTCQWQYRCISRAVRDRHGDGLQQCFW